MAKPFMLGKENYVVFAAMMSLVYIFSVPMESIQTMISKFTSKFNLDKDYGKMKNLLIKSLGKSFIGAVIVFILFIPLALFLSGAMNVDFPLIVFTGIMIFFAFLLPVPRGVMQGRKKFTLLGANMVLESVLKLSLAILLVWFGFKVYGAMAAVILGVFFVFALAFIFIKEVITSRRVKARVEKISSYSLPIFIVIFVITLMYSVDIILARILLQPEQAGTYAVISMMGKMIFFGTWAISKAMFPIASEEHEGGKDTWKLFKKAFLIVVFMCAVALLAFLFFPKFLISILFSKIYADGAGILFYIGACFSLLSLANLNFLYAISKNKVGKSAFLLFFFFLLQISLFMMFNQTLLHFALAFLVSSALIFMASWLYLAKR